MGEFHRRRPCRENHRHLRPFILGNIRAAPRFGAAGKGQLRHARPPLCLPRRAGESSLHRESLQLRRRKPMTRRGANPRMARASGTVPSTLTGETEAVVSCEMALSEMSASLIRLLEAVTGSMDEAACPDAGTRATGPRPRHLPASRPPDRPPSRQASTERPGDGHGRLPWLSPRPGWIPRDVGPCDAGCRWRHRRPVKRKAMGPAGSWLGAFTRAQVAQMLHETRKLASH